MEQIGLEATLKDAMFTAAIDAYMRGLDKMNLANQKFVGTASQINAASQKTGQSLQDMGRNADLSGSSFEGLDFKSMTLAVTLGNILANAIQTVVAKLKEMVTAGVMSAARVEEMDVVLQLIGNRAGYTKAQLDEMVQSIVKLGIQTDTAQDTMVQFIRNNLNLADAAKLARAAQDNAVIGMTDSSQALQRMIWGIQTLQPEILRSMGIIIKTDDAMKAYAETLGKTAAELSGTERQQAFLNAILKESEKNAGAYEASMTTVSKQIRSMSRETWELARAMGEPFLEALSSVVKTIRDLIKQFTTAFREGGAFRESMMQLGAMASIAADYIGVLARKFGDWIVNLSQGKDLLTWINDSILNMSSVAFTAAVAVAALTAAWLALKVAWTVGTGIVTAVKYIQFFIYGVQTLIAVLPILGGMLSGALASAATAVAGAFAAVAAALGVTTGGLALIIAAVAAVIAIIVILATNAWGARDALMAFFKDVGEMAKVAADWISKAFQDIATWITNAATSAFNWGANLVMEFANGIMDTANSWLTAAMNYIGSILSWWLSPGSAPNVAPDLTAWGIGAVNAWLEGFTQGDWNILQGIQQPLEQVFDYLQSIGQMANAGQAFADISKALIAAIESGEGFADILAQITSLTGVFGPELAELTEQYFQLAGALADVEDHEKKLADARKAQVDANKNTNKLIREYNQMLRGGASKEALAAKLAEIRASKDAEKAAAAQVTQEEDNLKAAYDTAQALKEQIDLTSQLVAMLLELAKAQTLPTPPTPPTPPGAPGGRGGAGGAGGGPPEPPEIPVIEVPKVDEIIENFKKLIQEKLANIWQSIKTRWAIWWTGIVRDIRFHWNSVITYGKRVWGALTIWFDENWAKVKLAATTKWAEITLYLTTKWDEIKLAAKTKWDEITLSISTKWDEIKLKAQTVWDEIKAAVLEKLRSMFADMGLDFDSMVARWKAIWEDVKLIVKKSWEITLGLVREKIAEVKESIRTKVDEVKANWAERWAEISAKVTEKWDEITGNIRTKVAEIKLEIQTRIDEVKANWDTRWTEIKTKAGEIWDEIKKGIDEKIIALKEAIAKFLTIDPDSILGQFLGIVAGAAQWGRDVVSGFKEGIVLRIGEVIEEITAQFENIMDKIKHALGIPHSPSEITKIYGKEIMEGLGIGIEKGTLNVEHTLAKSMQRVLNVAAPTPMSISNITNKTANINMGPITVNNGMDVAGLRGILKSVIREEFGGI